MSTLLLFISKKCFHYLPYHKVGPLDSYRVNQATGLMLTWKIDLQNSTNTTSIVRFHIIRTLKCPFLHNCQSSRCNGSVALNKYAELECSLRYDLEEVIGRGFAIFAQAVGKPPRLCPGIISLDYPSSRILRTFEISTLRLPFGENMFYLRSENLSRINLGITN